MNNEEFRKQAHLMVDWMADYLENIEDYPVKPDVTPGDIYRQLPANPPPVSESMDSIFADFKNIILPGITHWQHPGFHAYFPGNSSKPSVLAEMLTATLGAQCMVWATSPAAAELEEQVMEWLKDMLSLPDSWVGSIQNGASDATINAVLSAREKYSDYQINTTGLSHHKFRIYCSEQAHSSVDKAVALSGIGRDNLIKISVDKFFAMNPRALQQQIDRDRNQGYVPLMVVAALGTTGSTAIDPLKDIADITSQENIWLHIDAALAGSALLLKEMRWMADGLAKADSFVFNPHKWLFTNFDCSAYFVKDKQALINTFSINPEYLKTREDPHVNNYRDWGIPLGRRFRALKLWFVIRSYGVEGLQAKIRLHLELARWFEAQVDQAESFELLAPVPLNTICFRYTGQHLTEEEHNSINERLLHKVNKTGKIFITHVILDDKFSLRMVIGQTEVQKKHVEAAWELIANTAQSLAR
jgi:aromatic-L-amino-acid decarboxylase